MVHEIQGDGQDGNGLILYTSPRQPAQPVSLPLCSHYSPPCRIGLRTKPHSTKIMFSPLVLTSRCLICHHPQLVCSAGGLSGQSHSPQAPTHPSVNSRPGLLHSQKSKSRVVIVVVVGGGLSETCLGPQRALGLLDCLGVAASGALLRG